MKSEVNYPYLPKDKHFLFVEIENPFMATAKKVCDDESGCSFWPGASIIVKNGSLIGKSGVRGELIIPCARFEQYCATGTGYDLCTSRCKAPDPPNNHSEVSAIHDARQAGHDTRGADLYLFGHWWCCENCWNAMIDAGIRHVYLLKNAHLLFTRENRIAVMEKFEKNRFKGSPDRADVRWNI